MRFVVALDLSTVSTLKLTVTLSVSLLLYICPVFAWGHGNQGDSDQENNACSITKLSISGGGQNYALRTTIHPTQKLRLRSKVSIDCHKAKKAQFSWTASVGPPESALPYTLPSKVKTHSASLSIPSKTLNPGVYAFSLQVQVPTRVLYLTLSRSTVSWFEVPQGKLVATIAGGSALRTARNQDLILDASESRLPDGSDGNLEYTWSCFREDPQHTQSARTACFGSSPVLENGTSTLTVSASSWLSLPIPVTVYFMLNISGPGFTPATAYQTVQVVEGDLLPLQIKCIRNCGPSINPSRRLVLRSKKSKKSIQYTWSLYKDSAFLSVDWKDMSLTGNKGPILKLRAGLFTEGQHVYKIALTAQTFDGREGYAEYTFQTNSPPQPGSCSISPANGTVLQTTFNITCQDFNDTDLPLTYSFYALTGKRNYRSLLVQGLDAAVSGLSLPVGEADDDYNLVIQIQVTDAYGAATKLKQTVQVNPAVLGMEDFVSLITREDSDLKNRVNSGDMQGSMQLISSYTSFLNKEDNSETDSVERENKREKKKQARSELMNSVADMEVDNVDALHQKSSVLYELTKEASELLSDTRSAAAISLREMATFLETQANDSLVAADSLKETGLLMVSGLSNVLCALKRKKKKVPTATLR